MPPSAPRISRAASCLSQRAGTQRAGTQPAGTQPAGTQACAARGGAGVSGPGWLAGSFTVLMIAVSAYCASRLAGSWLRGKDTDRAADGLHVLMGIAMAGMLQARLAPVSGRIWCAVFAVAAAWFAWQASPVGRRTGRTRGARRARGAHPARGPHPARGAHPVPHAIECAAMIYMLAPVGSWPAGRGAGTAMPGMSLAGTAGNPALTLVLALFMLGYALHATDQLTALSRTRSAPAGLALAAPAATVAIPRAALAPRLAACYKIAMAITMGYMLVTML